MLGAVVGMATLAVAVQSGSGLLKSWSTRLQQAGGVTAAVTTQEVGGGRANYSVEMAAPNKVRLETPTTLVISDGSSIYSYYKAQKAYVKEPFDAKLLRQSLAQDEFRFFAPAIDAQAFDSFGSVTSAGKINRRGVEMEGVKAVISALEGKTATMYFAGGDLRQAEIVTKNGSKTSTSVLDVTTVKLGAPSDARFTFTAPAGSKQVTRADLMGGKWYYNLPEAMDLAKKSNKMVYLDFMFDG